MKPLKVFVCVVMVVAGVSCSRDPQVVKRRYVENGNRYFEKGKYKEAHIMYRNALRKDRKYGEAYYRIGLTELKLGQPLNAYRSFVRATETAPDNIDAKVQTGKLALAGFIANPTRNKAFGEHVAQLAADILKREPNNIEGLRLRAYHKLVALKDQQEALTDFRRANEIEPLQPDVTLPLVETLYTTAVNQPAEAEKLARALIAKHKTYLPIYDVLYVQLVRGNRTEDAEKILKLKADNNPTVAGPLLQLAAHYQATKRPAEAAATIERLVSDPKNFPEGRMEAGRFYARLRDFETSKRHFEEGAKADAEHRTRYLKAISEILIVQRRPHEAQRMLDEVIRLDPKDDDAKSIRASVQIDTGDPAQLQAALNDLEASIKQNPRNAVTRFNYARALVLRRQYDQARTQLQEAVKLNPMYLAPRLALAELQYVRGEYGLVRQTTREILEKVDPRSLPARLLESSALASSGERDAARRLLAEIVKDNPNSHDAQVQVALLDLSERKYALAEASFAKLYKDSPQDLRGLMGLVETYVMQGQHDRAIQILKTELERTPGRHPIRVALGNVSFKAGKVDEAIRWFQELVKVNANSGELHLKLGECYRVKGDLPNAIAYYQKARELQPNDALTHLQLAVLYDTAGRRDQARPIYEQVLKLQPDNAYALNNLAFLIAESGGDLDQALALAQRAKQRLPEHPDVADTLGWIYIKKNLTDNAVQILRELVNKQPERSTFRYHFGLALFQKGDKTAARRELTAALERRPAKDEELKIKELLAKIG